MSIYILSQEESYRLIKDEEHDRYAVVEARAGHVYSVSDDCHHHARQGAEDSPEGMVLVVDGDWTSEERARDCYDIMVRRERRYSETIW